MRFPATSPAKETSGVTFSVTSRRSLDCGRPTTGYDEGNSSRDFRMNRLAVHHFRYGAPTILGNFNTCGSESALVVTADTMNKPKALAPSYFCAT